MSKRPPLTFAASHAMAAAPGGTMPGVTLDDYARHALDRWRHFGKAIVAGAVAHLYRAGITPEQPQGMPRGRWLDMHMETDR